MELPYLIKKSIYPNAYCGYLIKHEVKTGTEGKSLNNKLNETDQTSCYTVLFQLQKKYNNFFDRSLFNEADKENMQLVDMNNYRKFNSVSELVKLVNGKE